MDNAGFHKGDLAKEGLKEYNLEAVWNVPYHFKFNNAVEKYWRALKVKFRQILLQKMLNIP
jgi:hypothetical protein